MTKAYNDSLYKEYALCSLKHYKDRKIGLRWRISGEVLSGKGESSCGSLECSECLELTTLEVDFEYEEEGRKKNSLVKIRLCPSCCSKFRHAKCSKGI
jgi:protein FRA10AC1